MRRLIIAFVVGAVVFVIGAVGASLLDISGSDTAPGTGKAEAACAGPLTITNPVQKTGHDNNRVVHVYVAGDMTRCDGQDMLVEVDLDSIGVAHAYGVHHFTDATTTGVTLTFDATAGDFRDASPAITSGSLVPTGTMLDPIKAKDFGLVTVTIAKSWEA